MSMQVADFPAIPADPGRAETYKGLELIRHHPCGVEILNVDLARPLSDDLFDAVMEVWHQGRVIVFRGQKLEPDDQLRFGRRVGELSVIHTEEFAGEDPAIMYISNVKEDGEFVHALPVGEMMFHIDQCYTPRPAKATILYAMEIPAEGGNTLFADAIAAYDALDQETKARIEGLKALNVYDYDAGATHTAAEVSPDAPRYAHPIARTHPVTGEKALFVNRLMTREIVGLPPEESRALLEKLFDHQENPAFVYEHRWRLGDLLMWDNRCTLHARRDFNPEETRLMRRLTVLGETPK
ncbi:MAG: TauD/TfdA family dioxygenase [Alphaproteobacteria bacterium]|nr:TauD/TfdA family dioxygenase [Alphaproteobacteria bacterium]